MEKIFARQLGDATTKAADPYWSTTTGEGRTYNVGEDVLAAYRAAANELQDLPNTGAGTALAELSRRIDRARTNFVAMHADTDGFASATFGELLRDIASLAVEFGQKIEPATPDTVDTDADDKPELAAAMKAATAAFKAGRLVEAEAGFRNIVVIRDKAVPTDAYLVPTLNNLAVVLHHAGKPREAASTAQRALELSRRIFGDDSEPAAVSYVNVATAFVALGRNEEALSWLYKAREIRLKVTPNDRYEMSVINNAIGTAYQALGQRIEAKKMLSAALEARREILGEDDPSTAITADNLALVLDDLGEYNTAHELHLAALRTRMTKLGPQHPDTRVSLGNMAYSLSLQGKAVEAESFYQQEVKAGRSAKGGEDLVQATALDNLAQLLKSQNRLEEAEASAGEALAIFRRLLGDAHPSVGNSYNTLSGLYIGRRKWKEAADASARAIAIREKALGTRHAMLAASYNNYGIALLGLGRRDEAELFVRKAIEIDREALGANSPQRIPALTTLATSLAARDPTGDEVLSLAREAVASAREQTRVSSTAAGQMTVTASTTKGDDPAAFAFATFLNIASMRNVDEPGLADETFQVMQDLVNSASARALALASAREAAKSLGLANLVRRKQDLEQEARGIDARELLGLSRGEMPAGSAGGERRAEISQQLSAINASIAGEFPEYQELVTPVAVPLAQARRALKPGEAIVVLVPLLDDVYVFAVTQTGLARYRALGQRSAASIRVQKLRCNVDALSCPNDHADWNDAAVYDLEAAYGLYRTLIAPVEHTLVGVTKLYVSATRELADLPLALLTTSQPPIGSDRAGLAQLKVASWLADRFAFTYLPSVSALARSRTRGEQAGANFVGYGNPTLTGDGNDCDRAVTPAIVSLSGGLPKANADLVRALCPLPGTLGELTALAHAAGAPDSNVHVQDDATELAFRADKAVASARFLAIATHGSLAGEGRSAGFAEPSLIFTPPAPGLVYSADNDGVLTASEAAQLNFSADWLMLSACNTASPRNDTGGDNLSALSRSFIYAGAHALLASHWRVSDGSTAVLTVEAMREREQRRLGRAEALQMAMRTVRSGRRSDGSPVLGWSDKWLHPSYWAAFTVVSREPD
ncbi:tetratricopeptide repeat protein [Sphingomonas sp. R86520]|uniref:CHAT domain-containing protein n=1 Tax=Sphingomonas sp. R86520 TaxID=3093859 RepID=UPI0036D2CB88